MPIGRWKAVLFTKKDQTSAQRLKRRVLFIDYGDRANGDVLPTVLVDGYVCGVWRPFDDRIEVRAFSEVTPRDWAALEIEAGSLAAFMAERGST